MVGIDKAIKDYLKNNLSIELLVVNDSYTKDRYVTIKLYIEGELIQESDTLTIE
jgi:hypothetical protein